MFKSWSRKNKIKAVFKMQFQATQVPKMKKSALMISLVPDDVGKPTVKLEKSPIRDGTCLWENPIFESVKLSRDAKSGNLHEKIYHFVVSTGSSKSGFLGEASIDFADFVAETEPVTISLPLKFANSGVILHVTIHNVEGYADQRNGEDNGTMGLYNDGGLKHQLSFDSTDESSYNVDEDGQSTKKYGYAEQNAIVKESTGTSYVEHSWEEFNTEHRATDGKATAQDASSFLAHFKKNPQTNGTVDAIATEAHARKRSQTDWSVGSASDGSLGEWTNSLEENLPRERLQEPTDNATENLKSEIAYLTRQVEVSELEMQSLRRQIAKESSQGQNMSKQMTIIREERDAIKTKYEQLRSQQNFNNETETSRVLQSEIKDAKLQLEATKEELVYEKELSANLKLQLQKTQNSNSQLILAVRDLEALLEQKNKELLDLSTNKNFKDLGNEPDDNDTKEVGMLKQKIADLNGEIGINNKHTKELNEHIKELSLEYELLKKENLDITLRLKQDEAQQIMLQNAHSASLATIQQLESQVDILEEKIKKQEDEISESLVCINELENQVNYLEKELKIQADNFEYDLHSLECAKTEQEERAIQVEEALRKTRHNNAITSERFQEEYRMLSVEMASKIEESEKETLKVIAKADELQQKNKLMEEMLQKFNQELRFITDQNELKMKELWNQIDSKEKTIEQMSQELEKKSKELEDAQRHREEEDAALLRQIQILNSEIKNLMTEHVTETVMQKNKERGNMDEKEMTLAGLLSEIEIFKIQHNKLKNSLQKEQVEKENMKKEFSHLQGELKKKEAELGILEKKLKNNRGRAAVTHAKVTSRDNEYSTPPSSAKTNIKLKLESVTTKGSNATITALSKSERGKGTESDENNISLAPLRCAVETYSANEMATFNHNDDCECNTNKLFTEVSMLKERNKSMENELKYLQERYSEISLKFAEVEGERQQLVMTVRNLKNGKKN